MAELNLTEVFNDCVDRLSQGQSVDDCLRRYPQYASTLRPMLETGALVQRMRVQPAEVLSAQTRVRPRFEDALRVPPRRRTSATSRFIYAIAAILIIGFIAVASLNAISQNSLPGDAMYSVKIFSEGLQRSLFDNDALETNFDQRRIQEIQQLLALGRAEDVTFNGRITAQNGTNWVIASLPITVPVDVPNASTARVNDEVEVMARTSELHLLTAKTIQITEAATTPIPTPVNISVPTPIKATQTPLITITSSLTPTVMVTQSVATINPTTPIQVPTLTTSATPQPIVTTVAPTECVATRPNGWAAYKIRSGDTLSALASGQSITLAELMAINCITDASHIIVGETIYLPNAPLIAPTSTNNSNQGSGSNNSGSNNSGNSNPTDDHGGGSNSGHGGGGSGGGSDDGSGHG